MAHFEEEDSNHSVNGWIKKEIEDDDFEEYLKQEHEEEQSGERYEELMSLSKEDLVGRILQQEEDIRYLQDIRHGLEKNVQGFSSSCAQFKRLLEVMSSTMSSFKEGQSTSSTMAASNTPRSAGLPTSLPTSRPTTSVPSSQASPRSTPTAQTSAPTPVASPRATPSIPVSLPNPRSTPSAVSVPANHMTSSSAVSNDRLHSAASMSSHQTVTITRQTNVIIKTEIPSPPPPEPMITSAPLMSTNVPVSSMPQPNTKNRNDTPAFYPTRQQVAQNNPKPFASTSSRTITEIANSIPPYRQRARVNPAPSFPANLSATLKANNQMNRTNMPLQQQQQFHAQRHPTPGHFVTGRGGRGRAALNQRSVPYMTQRPSPQTAGATAPLVRPRASAPPTSTSMSSPAPGASVVNDFLANISLKVPSGITLSIVPPKSNPESRTLPSSTDKTPTLPNAGKQGPVESSSRANVSQSLHSGSTPSIEEISSSKPCVDKGVSSSGGTNPSFSATNSISSMHGNFPEDEEEEEEEDYFDEIAVLIPDKKSSPTVEGSGQQNMSDSMSCSAVVSADSHSKSQAQSSESFWNSQNAGQKPGQTAYQNNAEYMFEEPDDLDSDENDAKVYLAENVTLPRELVDSCIKQGTTPTKLTRNLMQALFPDVRELASGCAEGDTTRLAQPLLPVNKVKAIIALVQKTFPQVKRSAIIMAMNMKCKEAQAVVTHRYASY